MSSLSEPATSGAGPIVLTGAGGFIGGRVLRLLAEQSRVPILAFGRRAPVPQDLGPTVKVVSDAAGNFFEHFASLGPFTWIHCAWCPPRRDAYRPHAEQVALIAEGLDRADGRIERIVALGSAEEYGTSEGKLGEAQLPSVPTSPYAWGKSAAADLLAGWQERSGRPVFWLRPFSVYGEGQGGSMAIPYAVRQAGEGKPAQFSDALQQRDFVHVDDVARAVVAAAGAPAAGAFQTVNIGTGRATALRQVLSEIAKLLHAENHFEFGVRPRRPGEPDLQYADIGRAADLLNWRPEIDLEKGLHRLCQNVATVHR